MNLQKHEKAALAAIREVLDPLGWEVRVEMGGRSKKVVWADAPGRREKYTIANSPANRDHEVTYARQWARRITAVQS